MLAGCSSEPPLGKLVWDNGRWVRGPAPVEGSPQGELALIRLHIEKRRYGEAVSQVEKFLKRYEGHPGRQEAMMLAGQAEEARQRDMQAYEWYEKQLQEYPAGEFSDRALGREYRIASDFLAGQKQVVWGFMWLSAEDEAIEILTRIAERAPMSTMAEDSLLLIGDYYFAEARYSQAAESYDDCVELFPRSARSPYASFRAARAVLSTYRGVKYRDTPLIEARLRFRTFADSYPSMAKAMNVDKILANIRKLLAHQDYYTARFYERVGRRRAAKFYYRQVTARYGRTDWSDRADEALKRLVAKEAQAGGEG